MTDHPYLIFKSGLKLFQKPWQQLDAAEQERVRHEAAEEFRLQQLVLNSDEAAKVTVEQSTVAGAVALIRQRYNDEQGFLDDLRAQGLDEATLHASLADELRVDAVLSLVGGRAGTASEAEVADFYAANRGRFEIAEIRKVRHILITLNDDFPENTRKSAWARIKELQGLLRSAPEKFIELAQQYSECPSALRQGELGEVAHGHLFPTLDQALFRLAEGEISDIVETHLGFHLILCEQIKPARTLSFEEAAPRIATLLSAKKQRQRQQQWLAELTA